MSTTLIRAAKVLCLDDSDTIYAPGYLFIEDGIIRAVGKQQEAMHLTAADTVDLGEKLIMPGLINAHTHSPMVLFRGLVEGNSLFNFDGWYNTIRVVEEKMTPDLLPAAVAVSCAEMIRTGTTTFADQYFWMEQIVPVVRRSGLRAALAYGIVELGAAETRRRELAAATEFLQEVSADLLITGWVGPHAFFVDNSEAAMVAEKELAERFGTGFHIHLATSGEEDRYCQERYGRSAIQQLLHMGLLDRPIIAAHCLTIPAADFDTLARHPFTVVVAASSCMRNAAGVAPLKAFLAAGVNAALGTDNVTNNNSYDLFKEMALTGKLMSLQERTPNAIPTRKILEMATLGGAQALGLADKIGSLEVGKYADLITLDLEEIGWSPTAGQDPYTALVYAVSGYHVRDVMVHGRWLLRNNEFTTLDFARTRADLEEAYARLVTTVG